MLNTSNAALACGSTGMATASPMPGMAPPAAAPVGPKVGACVAMAAGRGAATGSASAAIAASSRCSSCCCSKKGSPGRQLQGAGEQWACEQQRQEAEIRTAVPADTRSSCRIRTANTRGNTSGSCRSPAPELDCIVGAAGGQQVACGVPGGCPDGSLVCAAHLSLQGQDRAAPGRRVRGGAGSSTRQQRHHCCCYCCYCCCCCCCCGSAPAA